MSQKDRQCNDQKGTKGQRMIYKTLHRKLKIDQHEPPLITGSKLRCQKGFCINFVLLITILIVLFLIKPASRGTQRIVSLVFKVHNILTLFKSRKYIWKIIQCAFVFLLEISSIKSLLHMKPYMIINKKIKLTFCIYNHNYGELLQWTVNECRYIYDTCDFLLV
jgi:hypothetical protein